MDLDLMVHREEEGELTVRLGFRRTPAASGSELVIDGDLALPGAGERMDGARTFTATSSA
jgi:hypothetical protein